jgi:glycosyltransferase involved in cell wall biosynthesis
MRIALDISPLQTGHKVRGVGFYLKHLKDSLEKYYPNHDYLFFSRKEELTGKIDVVHYPYFDPFFISLPLKKRYPTVVTVHDLTPLVFPQHFPAGIKGKLRWQIQKQSLRNVDMVLADSEASRNDIIRIAGVSPSNVAVAYLAAGEHFRRIENREEKIKGIRKKFGLPEKFALYVGDVTWNKNLPNLIHAAIQAEIHLVMVGKSLVQADFDATNPWNRDLVEVQRLTKDEPLVKKLGFVDDEDLVTLYNAATVFVMPSHYEGFGLPIIEAMQSGCPVITTKNGSLPEVAGDAAVYIDGDSVDEIAKKIQDVCGDKKLQKELSVKGLERANQFSWKKTAEQTMKVYESAK